MDPAVVAESEEVRRQRQQAAAIAQARVVHVVLEAAPEERIVGDQVIVLAVVPGAGEAIGMLGRDLGRQQTVRFRGNRARSSDRRG